MSIRFNPRLVGKQVRAFNLDNDVGSEIDREGGDNKSKFVNELLREALERRRHDKLLTKSVVEFSEGTTAVMVTCLVLWIFQFVVTTVLG